MQGELRKGGMMKENVGLWIDHKKAVILFVGNGDEVPLVIESEFEKYARSTGGSPSVTPVGSRDVCPDDKRQRKFILHLNGYLDRVISRIRGASSILVLGPGEAKGQLKRRLQKKLVGRPVIRVETADKMTDRQFAATVRKHFVEA